MHRKSAAAVLLMALGISGCARGPAIVRDPLSVPVAIVGAMIPGQARPVGMPVGADPNMVPLPVIQADFAARAGSNIVRFGRDEFLLDQAARNTLALQADWLRMNPMVRASIEGHADVRQTREHALALAERRAAAVHSFLLAQGVSPAQLSVISWGKERPASEGIHDASWLQNSRVATVLLREPVPAPAPFGVPPMSEAPPPGY